MKKHGKDFLFCGLLCLGSFLIPFLTGWILEEVTTSEEIGNNAMISLLVLLGTFSAVFSVFKGKHFLIYPAVNAVFYLFIGIMGVISTVNDLGGYMGVETGGTDLETLTSLFATGLSVGVIVVLIVFILLFAGVSSLGTLLVSFIAKRIYDKNNAKLEAVQNEEV